MGPIQRKAAVMVASGVAVASLAVQTTAGARPAARTATPAAKSATTSDPAAAAAGYLARKLAGKNNDHLTDKFGGKTYPDDGETADAVLSMDAAGVAQSAAKRATKWLEKDAVNYMGQAPDIYPGSAAKLLLVAEAQHVNPESFGGNDLIGDIVGDEGAGGAAPGEYQNPGDLTYGSSVLDQSLAVLALADTTSTADQPSSDAVAFLAGQQCDDGAFEIDIRTDTGTDCATADDDVDTTGYAVQALVAAGDRGAADAAVGWLRSVEHNNGGWGEEHGAHPDANSTALAVQALIVSHHNANNGVSWLTKQQLGCSSKAKRRGAVTFQGSYDASAVRATSQAGAALALRPLAWIDKNGATKAAPKLACPSHKSHHQAAR
jgi:hypothetical protein